MALTERQEAKLEQMRKGKGGFDFGNQGKRAPQYYGGKNGYRKLGTLQNLLTSGDISSINKKEWGRLKDLESGKLAVGANGQAIKPTTTGVTSGPASTTKGLPGNNSMREAGEKEFRDAMNTNALNAIKKKYEGDVSLLGTNYALALAEGAGQFSDQVLEDGIDAASAGVGLNPAIAGARYMDNKKDYRNFVKKTEKSRADDIRELTKRYEEDTANVGNSGFTSIWNLLLNTPTQLRGSML